MDVGRVALRRGPLVYCVEEADNPALRCSASACRAARRSTAAPRSDLFDGIVVLSPPRRRRPTTGDWNGNLYRTEPPAEAPAKLTALPYYLWDNRGPGSMTVWIPET